MNAQKHGLLAIMMRAVYFLGINDHKLLVFQAVRYAVNPYVAFSV